MANQPQSAPQVDMVAKFASINRGAFMGRLGKADDLSEGALSMAFISLEKMIDILRSAPNASAMISTLLQMLGIKGLDGAFSFMQDVNFGNSIDLRSLGIFKGLSKSAKTILSSAGTNYTR
jgi:hypothetical protein